MAKLRNRHTDSIGQYPHSPTATSARWVLYTLVVLTPLLITPWTLDSVELPKILALRIGIVVGWIILLRRMPAMPSSPLHLSVLALLGITLLATVFSAIPLISLIGAYQHYGGLLAVADGVLLYALAVMTLRTPEDRWRLVRAMVVAGALTSLYGIVQHFGIGVASWEISDAAGTAALAHRSFATLSNPSFLGLYLAVCLPLAMAAVAFAKNRWSFVGWGSALALITICLVFTYSRAAWLAAGIGGALVLLAPMPSPVRRWSSVVLVLATVVIGGTLAQIGAAPSALSRLQSIVDPGVGSTQIRLQLWHGTWAMMTRRPLLGWGPDTFRYVFPRVAPAGMTEIQRRNVSAHNDLLDRAAQTGVFGLLIYLGLLGIAMGIAHRAWVTAETQRQEVAILCAALLAFFIATQFGFASAVPIASWWLLFGCLAACTARKETYSQMGTRLAVVLITCWMAITVWTGCCFIADIYCRCAEMARTSKDARLAAKEFARAAAWNPAQDYYAAQCGASLLECGETAQALLWVKHTMSLNPLNAANAVLLAQANEQDGDIQGALQAWRIAVTLDPQWPQTYNALGIAYHRTGDDAHAILAYQRAIALDPKYATAFNNLGNIYLGQGKYTSASACYQQALKLRPGWDVPERNLALLRKR